MEGFINLYKPAGMTSFDCVAKLRKMLSTKKIGHAGTLDPDAVGVLPIAVGRATRLLEYITAVSKQYRATMVLGIETSTQDASGEIVKKIDSAHLTKNHILNIISKFLGEIEQIPPMYSAIKINGKRLYELARQNIEVEREPRKVYIHSIDLIEFEEGQYPKVTFDIVCSKGTYIRTLLQNMGESVSSTAHMSFLKRTKVGKFSIESSYSFEEITALLSEGSNKFLLGLDYPLEQLGKIYVEDDIAERILHGNKISIDNAAIVKGSDENTYCIYNKTAFLAIATIIDQEIRVQKVLQTEGETT